VRNLPDRQQLVGYRFFWGRWWLAGLNPHDDLFSQIPQLVPDDVAKEVSQRRLDAEVPIGSLVSHDGSNARFVRYVTCSSNRRPERPQ
jgi:hypothetical protein